RPPGGEVGAVAQSKGTPEGFVCPRAQGLPVGFAPGANINKSSAAECRGLWTSFISTQLAFRSKKELFTAAARSWAIIAGKSRFTAMSHPNWTTEIGRTTERRAQTIGLQGWDCCCPLKGYRFGFSRRTN